MTDTVTLAVDGRGVARLRLTRAGKHNALSAPMIDAMTEAARALGADDAVRVVVLAAEGSTFCAGGDLNWMRAQMVAAPEERRRAARALAGMLGALDTLPKPLIGRVQGNAFGGGVGLMAVCDTVVAGQGARFGLTETRLGLIPATIGPYVVARMGAARARGVMMSARIFDADEAQALGLVTRVVEAGALDAAVEAEVAPYLACAPGAVARAKAMVRALGPAIDEAVIERSIDDLMACWASGEAAEGIAAFFDKRPPEWSA